MAKGTKPKTARKNKKGHCQVNSLCPARFAVCETIDGKVEARRQESFNPVLLYKQQGIEDPAKRLSKKDFILAFMTKQQLDRYQQFAGRILCMDSTHKTNSYSFK